MKYFSTKINTFAVITAVALSSPVHAEFIKNCRPIYSEKKPYHFHLFSELSFIKEVNGAVTLKSGGSEHFGYVTRSYKNKDSSLTYNIRMNREIDSKNSGSYSEIRINQVNGKYYALGARIGVVGNASFLINVSDTEEVTCTTYNLSIPVQRWDTSMLVDAGKEK